MAVALDYAAPRQAADAERQVEREGARGDRLHRPVGSVAEPQHGHFAEFLPYRPEGVLKG